MHTMLWIDCSPQSRSRSVTRQITRGAVEEWRHLHPGCEVIRRDLARTPLMPLGQDWIDGADVSTRARTETQEFALAQSEQMVNELFRAELIVLGAPMHNFTVPAVLKLWLDHVIRSERTVSFRKDGPVGFLTGRKVVVVIASGGDYTEGTPASPFDFETGYLTFILRVLGLEDVTFVRAYNTARVKRGEISLNDFVQPFHQEMLNALRSMQTVIDELPLNDGVHALTPDASYDAISL